MKIKLTSVHVDDQKKALRFYTEVLVFLKKADFSQATPQTYQQSLFQQGLPAAMFYSDDVQADYERMKTRGAEFTLPPTDVTASKIAIVNDTCGNLIQVTQLMRW